MSNINKSNSNQSDSGKCEADKPEANITFEISLERLADFFNEAGMLRNIERSGFAFLGSGRESVAEHSFRTAVIGFSLANLLHANVARTIFLCLFHDLHEARTGDLNYVNYRYDTCNEKKALEDCLANTGLENEILGFFEEFQQAKTLEAQIAKDADQLDLICNLQEQLYKGNEFAKEWLDSALPRLRLPESRRIALIILRTNPNRWWFGNVEKSWWINRK